MSPTTLIDVFNTLATQADASVRLAVECGTDKWTYAQLHAVVYGLASHIEETYGPRPIVAFISENHPFILAVMLATWSINGTIAPLDIHAPAVLMRGMLDNIRPHCVVIPATDEATLKIAEDAGIPAYTFTASTSSIRSLSAQFPSLPACLPRQADPASIALYVFTSSASSVANLKSVPLSQETIYRNCVCQLEWHSLAYPEQSFADARVLGWAPWTHIIGISHDIGAHSFLTGGCYVFGVIPTVYEGQEIVSGDVVTKLVHRILHAELTDFAGVPFVLEGIMKKWKEETDEGKKERLEQALSRFKVWSAGGAVTPPEVIEWANQVGLPLVLAIGMSEFGGPSFHTRADVGGVGWAVSHCLIPEVELLLVDAEGNPKDLVQGEKTYGELHVKSKFISSGYRNYPSSAFSQGENGMITFCTGDLYSGWKTERGEERILWEGRLDDYIQESAILEPERMLNEHPSITRACVVGNNFLGVTAQQICAIIQPSSNETSGISAALSAVNRVLLPPLRISWSRVLVLKPDEVIPLTRKGVLFRKIIRDLFGDRLLHLLADAQLGALNHLEVEKNAPVASLNTQDVRDVVCAAVAEGLKLSRATVVANSDLSFAELGMDSSMAVIIVNLLNLKLGLQLPLNACHNYIDLNLLTGAVLERAGLHVPEPIQAVPSLYTQPETEEIVIVGQSVRLPGGLDTPAAFWQALIDQRDDLMEDIPADRWDHPSFYNPDTANRKPGDISFTKSGFVNIASFDNTFFGIPPQEAMMVAPSVRLALEVAYDALEDANIPPSSLKGTDAGVFVACGPEDGWHGLMFGERGFAAYSRFYGLGAAASTACGRLSYLLDVHGPSIVVDTACSGGLVALHYAAQHLRSGDGETAIVLATNTHIWPGMLGFVSAQNMASPSGRCATFTNEADGYVPSEGAVALILKTRSAAIRDGDNILGVVKSTHVRHNGRSQGLVAPNLKAQIALHQSLLARARLSPGDIDFVEAHGTGTQLGDQIEIEGISSVFNASHTVGAPLLVGASKTVVGHTESAAGLVGVVKSIQSFKHRVVPGLAHLRDDNLDPGIDCTVVPMHIPTTTTPLPSRGSVPVHALVLAYGFAGTISGTILEGPQFQTPPTRAHMQLPMLFVVSARSPAALKAYKQLYINHCDKVDASEFDSICYTSCVGRQHYRYRYSCVAKDLPDLVSNLRSYLKQSDRSSTTAIRPCVVFAFPGQGSQYQGMSWPLANRYPGFQKIVVAAASEAGARSGFEIASFLLETTGAPDALGSIDDSQIAQICTFVHQYSVACWLKSLGVSAGAVLGHSLGEITAAVISSALSFTDGLSFVIARARILRGNSDHPGAMAAVGASREVVVRAIQRLPAFLVNAITVAVYNGPESVVVSGASEAVEKVMAVLKVEGVRVMKLAVDQGFHSSCIDPVLPDLSDWLRQHEGTFGAPAMPFFSSLFGGLLPASHTLGSAYWTKHARDPVQFAQAADTVIQDSNTIVLDLGPQPTIWSNLQGKPGQAHRSLAACAKKGKDQNTAVLSALGSLFERNVGVDLELLFLEGSYTKTGIPTYPWQRQRFFPDYIPSRNTGSTSRPTKFPVNERLFELLDDHRIEGRKVVPAVAFADFLLSTAEGPGTQTLEHLQFHRPLILESSHEAVNVKYGPEGAFSVTHTPSSGATPLSICSGSFALSTPYVRPVVILSSSVDRVMNQKEVYSNFPNVQFGPRFKNVQELRMYSTHADAHITLEPSSDRMGDRVRKLDPCIHVFGAVARIVHTETRPVGEGAYLPTSFDSFVLYADDIPDKFVCRYILPLKRERNFHVISTCIEILSMGGQLLGSCSKFSVAWVPSGLVGSSLEKQVVSWASLALVPGELQATVEEKVRFDGGVYFGGSSSSPVFGFLRKHSHGTCVAVSLSDGLESNVRYTTGEHTPKLVPVPEFVSMMTGQRLTVILDVESVNHSTLESGWRSVLGLLKFIYKAKWSIAHLLLVTSSQTTHPVVGKEDTSPPLSALGPIAQGMLRVWRSESGQSASAAWGLELSAPSSFMDSEALAGILESEFLHRVHHGERNSFASYHANEVAARPTRMVHRYHNFEITNEGGGFRPKGVVVIAGMGSIGLALGSNFATTCDAVVYLGRRFSENDTVTREVAHLRAQRPGAIIHYEQANVSDVFQVVAALKRVQERFGSVKIIVQTAAVVKDALIGNVSEESFKSVLDPKLGAWNLHLAAQTLAIKLDSFVMLSSISVPLGNPGQISYVAGNSFLDYLANYRQSLGLCALSIQLGAWTSQLTEKLDASNSFVSSLRNDEGVAFILNAMARSKPIQLVASLRLDIMREHAAFSVDPLWSKVLGKSTFRVSNVEPGELILEAVREALELGTADFLDVSESLNALGIDSISFTQIRGQVLQRCGVELPLYFLGDEYSVTDVVEHARRTR